VRLFAELQFTQPEAPAPYIADTVYAVCAPILVTLTGELNTFDVNVTCVVLAPLTCNWAAGAAGKGLNAARAAIRKQAVLLNENTGIRAASMVSPDHR